VAAAEQPDLRRSDPHRCVHGAAVPDSGVARPVGQICVVAFSVAIPLLAALVVVNRQESLRGRQSGAVSVAITQVVAQTSAFVGVVAGFWHILWIAGVAVLISGLAGVAVHSAGYVRLEWTRGPRLRQPTSPAGPGHSHGLLRLRRPSPGPASRPDRRTRTRPRRSRSRTSAWAARPRCGSRPGNRPHVRTTSTRRNTAKAAQGRPSSRSPSHSTTQAPRRDPHPAHPDTANRGWSLPWVGSSAATHPTGVTRVT
jgi:hypothetical protein